MFRKIDCVMMRVDDLEGMGFPETDAEIVLHCKTDIAERIAVHYLVDDVVSAVQSLREQGCVVLVEPFAIEICCVIISGWELIATRSAPRRPAAPCPYWLRLPE